MNVHWYLGVIDHKRRLVTIFDSLQSGADFDMARLMRDLVKRMEYQIKDKHPEIYNSLRNKLMYQYDVDYPIKGFPCQTDVTSCGVMVMCYAEVLAASGKLTPNSFDAGSYEEDPFVMPPMECQRLRIAQQLIEHSIRINIMKYTSQDVRVDVMEMGLDESDLQVLTTKNSVPGIEDEWEDCDDNFDEILMQHAWKATSKMTYGK